MNNTQLLASVLRARRSTLNMVEQHWPRSVQDAALDRIQSDLEHLGFVATRDEVKAALNKL